MMIPKTIHYCWFGEKPLPELAKKCIESWRKFFPDYEIKEWNENNFDVNVIPYTQEAYAAGKYAFVSDYARFWILYRHGGIYFDTDVEVIKPMDDIVPKGAFMGIEKLNRIIHDVDHASMVNPGLGMGAAAGNVIYKEILDYYDDLHWCDERGVPMPGTVVTHTTKILLRHGFVQSNTLQCVAGIYIYPSDVLCPMDSATGLVKITPSTVSIHHYTCSWMKKNSVRSRLHVIKNCLIRLVGERLILSISKIFH